MNSYDVELALSYYTDDYREAEREEVESDISRLRQFKVTLSLESISEPVPVAQGRVNHDVVLGTPIGDRHLVYELVEIDGDWKIYMETMPERLLEAREFIIGFLGEHDTSQRIDLSLNAKSHDIEPAVFEKVLVDLINAGEVVELEEGLYALAE